MSRGYSAIGWVDGSPPYRNAANLGHMDAGIDNAADRLDRLVFDVKDYGATGDGSNNDSVAVQAAFDAANTAGGGIVYFPAGTYMASGLVYYGNCRYVGTGRGASVIKLAAATNTHLLTSDQFATFTGTTTNSGAHHVGFQDLVIDGNKAGQSTGSGVGIRHYGAMMTMNRVIIRNCRGDGLYSEWTPATDIITDGCEANFDTVSSHDNGGNGYNFLGPHDSIFANCIAFGNAAVGFLIKTSANASQCHSWSNSTAQTYAWRIEGVTHLINCQGEGASVAQCALFSNDCTVIGGMYYAGSVNGGKGIIIGDATHTGIAGSNIDTKVQDCPAGGIDFTNDGGLSTVRAIIYTTSGVAIVGTPPATDVVSLVYGGGATGFSYSQLIGETTLKNSSGTDIFDVTGTALSVPNSATVDLYSDSYTTMTAQLLSATGGIRPGTTAGRGATIYSGSGAPTSQNGTAGDIYFRTGTPSTANQRVYICTSTGTPGTWSGIL